MSVRSVLLRENREQSVVVRPLPGPQALGQLVRIAARKGWRCRAFDQELGYAWLERGDEEVFLTIEED